MNDEPLLSLLHRQGYTSLRRLGGQLCGLKGYNFTCALVVGLDAQGYGRRYCYESGAEALEALGAWSGEGHPPGPWIKCKGAGIDLLNPAFGLSQTDPFVQSAESRPLAGSRPDREPQAKSRKTGPAQRRAWAQLSLEL
jgi:hypothetical protein